MNSRACKFNSSGIQKDHIHSNNNSTTKLININQLLKYYYTCSGSKWINKAQQYSNQAQLESNLVQQQNYWAEQ